MYFLGRFSVVRIFDSASRFKICNRCIRNKGFASISSNINGQRKDNLHKTEAIPKKKERWTNVRGSRRDKRHLLFSDLAPIDSVKARNLKKEEYLRPKIERAEKQFDRITRGRFSTDVNLAQNWERQDLKNPPRWLKEKLALKEKLKGEFWRPNKRISPEKMQELRDIASEDPSFKLQELADMFGINVIATKKILKSKWFPKTVSQAENRQMKWKKRGRRIVQLKRRSPIV